MLLLLAATVVVVVVVVPAPEVVPEAGVVTVGAAALDAVPDEEVPEEEFVFDATVPVDAAPVFATVAVVAVVSIPCERSIMPTFGDTRLAVESEAVEAAAALLDPSPPPQAARVSVASVHRTMLRI